MRELFVCIAKKTAHRALAALLCTAVLCALPAVRRAGAPAAAAVSAHEWGLSFQRANEPPVPNLSAQALRPYGAYYCGDSGQKHLYLTFDAGYENGNTGPILDALQKHGAHGTFFVTGSFVRENPDLVRRIAAEGHALGNHTMHHPDMAQKSRAAFERELTDLSDLVLQTTGAPAAPFYRPPEGRFTEDNLTWAQQLGYRTVLWSLAYVDWDTSAQPSRAKALQKLLPRTHDGAIVLLHSTSAANAAVLDELLTRWEALGYIFAPLDELGAPESAPAA